MPWLRTGTSSRRFTSSPLPTCTRRSPNSSCGTKREGAHPRLGSSHSSAGSKKVSEEANSLGSSTTSRPWSPQEGYRMVSTPSHVEFLEAVYMRTYEEEVVQDLINYLVTSSLRQYESGWKLSQQYCVPLLISSVVASFLGFCSQALSPRTILTTRTALALPLPEGVGISLEHRRFLRLAKLLSEEIRQPKVVRSWSLDQVLQALSKFS